MDRRPDIGTVFEASDMGSQTCTNLTISDTDDTPAVQISGDGLTIEDVAAVARHSARVALTEDPEVWRKANASVDHINRRVACGEPIYGVTSGFGGMANVVVPPEQAPALQTNLIRFMTAGAGGLLPRADVRAAMLLRANSHLKGASGIRREVIERMAIFLNEDVTPHVREYGSIGASGDLVPLSSIAGAVFGLDPSYRVDFRGEETDCRSALTRLGLKPVEPYPKEALAMINGTSVMTGIAANCVADGRQLLALSIASHCLFVQGLYGTNQSFHPFIHQMKPHPGQVWTAEKILRLLDGSAMVRDELEGQHDYRGAEPIQDRYSLRCLPQYMGPIVDGLNTIGKQVTVEMNSATDNPLIDPNNGNSFHGGNFLGQYIGVGMDQFRYYLGLLAKHLDVQIALLVAPEFNNGLPSCLVGNTGRKINMGLKGLQICGNSILPLLLHLGNSLADRYPTHAEQFNQNINSQGFGSANLARQAVELFQQYMAVALIHGVQAVDLRTFQIQGHYDAAVALSPGTLPLYQAVKTVTKRRASKTRPFIWNDDEQSLEDFIERIVADIRSGGRITAAVESITADLRTSD
jgi:phenylalanine ammonia-lyase